MAAVWRRLMFTTAMENVAPETLRLVFEQELPSLAAILQDYDPLGTRKVLEDAYKLSRMLHGAPDPAGRGVFYRSFVPEIGSTLNPRLVELSMPCRLADRGGVDHVGVTLFLGLVEVSRDLPGPEVTKKVLRRAHIICKCALQAMIYPSNANSNVEI